jgi:hypothetical protein
MLANPFLLVLRDFQNFYYIFIYFVIAIGMIIFFLTFFILFYIDIMIYTTPLSYHYSIMQTQHYQFTIDFFFFFSFNKPDLRVNWQCYVSIVE